MKDILKQFLPKEGPPVNEANCRKWDSDKEGGITDIPEGVIEVFGLTYNEATVLSMTEPEGSLKAALRHQAESYYRSTCLPAATAKWIGGADSSASSGLGEFTCGALRTHIVIRWAFSWACISWAYNLCILRRGELRFLGPEAGPKLRTNLIGV